VARPDVLLVSLGTTLGWRRADGLLLGQIERAGASATAVSEETAEAVAEPVAIATEEEAAKTE